MTFQIKSLRVRELAEAHGLNVDDLSRGANLKFTTVSNIWYGRVVNPSLETIIPLARLLQVSVEDLIIEEEKVSRDPSSSTTS